MKKQAGILRLSITLLLITAIVALMLGAVNSLTEGPIAQRKEQATKDALSEVLSGAETFEAVEFEADEEGLIQTVYEAKAGDELVGWCIEVTPNGYGGAVDTMVGISKENMAVSGISIIEMSETANLGARAKEPEFRAQYAGKSGELTVSKFSTGAENEIVAISGATTTTKAVTKGVQAALDYAKTLEGGEAE